jgi:hypothetical protein
MLLAFVVATGKDGDVTNPTELEPQDRNRFMVERIRSGGTDPYQEGRYVLRVISVAGRTSGHQRQVPIAVPTVGGEHYLCAPNRRRDWVRNLLAADGACEIEGDPHPRHRAVLVEDESAAIAVRTYLTSLGRPSPEWPFPEGASPREISTHLKEIAVFRLEPIAG